ncbi:MAG: PQQ-binding-like beta-propeller repeat protein, partial [Gemmatimonadales bacterium]
MQEELMAISHTRPVARPYEPGHVQMNTAERDGRRCLLGLAVLILPVLACWGQPGPPRPGTPAVADGVLFFGTEDGVLHAVDIQTRTENWQLETDGGR